MTRLRTIAPLLLVCLAAAPASAQNRTELQLMAELRMMHEEVQRLQANLNAIVEQLKATNTRIDTQAEETRKGFANQGVAIGEIRNTIQTLSARENESAVNVSRLTGEMKSIRDGLTIQQTLLNNIINLLQTPPDPNAITTPPGGTSPAGGAPPPANPPPAGPGIPASPSSYYSAAFGYYAATKFDEAIEMAREAIKQFPSSPDAPRAQMTIGESYYQLGKFKDALEAYTAVITNYKESDQVPDAYYKQGLAYQQLGQRTQARASYTYVIKNYPDSVARTLAEQALKKLGG
jgi:tol-pal system protein YbgF